MRRVSSSEEFGSWLDKRLRALAPGSPLPTGEALAAQWGLSTATVGRILRRLRRAGKIVRVRGRGTFVAGGSPSRPPDLAPPRSSTQRLADAIYRSICSGGLKHGEALPQVKFVSRQFGVTPKTAIGAYRTLVERGLVEKVGRTYWVGSMDQLVRPRGRKDVYLINLRSDDFSQIYSSDLLAVAYQKMEWDLRESGYRMHYEGGASLEPLCREWLRTGRVPSGVVFHHVGDAQLRSILPILQELSRARGESGEPRILVDLRKGPFYRIPKNVHVLSRGNIDTSAARTVARYILEKGWRESVLIHDDGDYPRPLYWAFLKIGIELKALHPRFVFHQIVRPGRTRRRRHSLADWLRINYAPYLFEKYPVNQFDALVGEIRIADALYEEAARLPGARLWLCSRDRLAAGACSWLRARGKAVPGDVALMGFENDPAYYHLGLSSCTPDLERIGYAMAHAVIGDVPIPRTTRGFLRVYPRLLHRLTTEP